MKVRNSRFLSQITGWGRPKKAKGKYDDTSHNPILLGGGGAPCHLLERRSSSSPVIGQRNRKSNLERIKIENLAEGDHSIIRNSRSLSDSGDSQFLSLSAMKSRWDAQANRNDWLPKSLHRGGRVTRPPGSERLMRITRHTARNMLPWPGAGSRFTSPASDYINAHRDPMCHFLPQ